MLQWVFYSSYCYAGKSIHLEKFCYIILPTLFYDLPNIIGLPAELTLWQRRWDEKVEEVGIDKLPDRVSKTLISVDSVAFPNIFTILKVLATIPVTSCSCERSISSLRLLKNYLRNLLARRD